MLYQAYQVQSDVLTPVRLFAEAARGLFLQPWPLIGDHPMMRGAAAACELVSRAAISHRRPEFGIDETWVAGKRLPVVEEAPFHHPFCSLVHFAKPEVPPQPRLLLVAPLSGH